MTLNDQEYLVSLGGIVGLNVRPVNRGGVIGVSYGSTWTADTDRAYRDLRSLRDGML